ncbi:hypothetical protein P3X46_026220 [Hevea brasiliensis]|uniref:Uncharacterized protein n=1 Tax=Hevea brasiliensis TaxID=3981 RepID=A0ABQ9KVX4_HEVBR|nr:organ-specific protein S2 [Hevea brasiliensis]KAJ9152678.1 hypothetical protein P3X46_026220 [Hevea brasiliensis]
MKKLALAFFLLFPLLSFANLSYARKLPEDYWKSIMKDQKIPEAIRGLFVEDPAAASSLSGAKKKNHFVKDFDTRTIAVIYRSKGDNKKMNRIHGEDSRDDEIKGEKSFVDQHKNPEMEVPVQSRDHEEKV